MAAPPPQPDDAHRAAAPYGITPRPSTPDLPGVVVHRAHADNALDELTADLVAHSVNCVREFGDFHLALSGGRAFESLYMRLMIDPACRHIPWKRTHLWLVEDARVPEGDPRSDYALIRDLIVEHSDIPDEQAHPIDAHEPDAARRYERVLRETLAWREKGHDRLDYVLLHARSAPLARRPHTPPPALVGAIPGEPGRIAMTHHLVSGARFVAACALGAEAGPALSAQQGAAKHPAQPVAGAMRWYIDDEACAI